MKKKHYDLVIIGSGPGGYVAAIRAAQRKLSVALVENRQAGGTCLNRGCIPSKALIANADLYRSMCNAKYHGIHVENLSFDYKSMAHQKDQIVNRIRQNLEQLIKKNQIDLIVGFGKFESSNCIKVLSDTPTFLEAKNVIIATGSEPKKVASMPFDYQYIHDSTSLLEITELPKSILIVGGGVIGCEFASLHNAFNSKVTILELLPALLNTEGQHVSEAIQASFEKKGIHVRTSTVVEKVLATKGGVTAYLANKEELRAECALIAIGRKYNSDQLGLEKAGVNIHPSGTIPVNEYLQTNQSHIYAIGDVTGKSLYAHVASHQGLIASDHAAGIANPMHYDVVPAAIFTDPEIGTIGLTLEKAIAQGYDATIGRFPFQALGKSQATGHTEGFSQVVISKSTGQILGAQVVGYGASVLIAEIALAMRAELTIESISDTIHAHPTIAEAWMESAFIANHLPLHLPPRMS